MKLQFFSCFARLITLINNPFHIINFFTRYHSFGKFDKRLTCTQQSQLLHTSKSASWFIKSIMLLKCSLYGYVHFPLNLIKNMHQIAQMDFLKCKIFPLLRPGGGALTYISMRTCSRKKAGKGVFCRQSHGPRGPRFGEKGPIVQQWAFTYPRLGCQFHKHDKGLAIQHFCRVLWHLLPQATMNVKLETWIEESINRLCAMTTPSPLGGFMIQWVTKNNPGPNKIQDGCQNPDHH